MLGLTSSITKPTSLAKQRSVAYDGISTAATIFSEKDAGVKPPTTGAGTDRSHTYAAWVKFNNTNAEQSIFTTGNSATDGLNILMTGSKAAVMEWKDGNLILDHEGDAVLTSAIKQDWMLWVITHNRPADDSTGTSVIYINGTTSTYGSTASSYNGTVVNDNGGNLVSPYLGYCVHDMHTFPSSYSVVHLNGNIAQFGYWTRVLTAAEVLAMYNDPKMDWRFNSGNYTNTSIQRYFKPFSNQIDHAGSLNFKIRELANYVPHVPTVCDDEDINSWVVIWGSAKTDLGSGETKFDVGSNVITSYVTMSGAGVLDANVDAGTELTYTFKARIVTDSNTTATFGLFGGSTIISGIPSNQAYQEFSATLATTHATGNLMMFSMSQVNANDELYVKDFVVTKPAGGTDRYWKVTQSDQISDDAPGN